MATSLTAFGVFIASRMKKIDGFQAIMQFLMFPMFFLSGSQFPIHSGGGLPGWLVVLTRVNPLSYAVDPMRRIMLQDASSPAIRALADQSQVDFFGNVLPLWTELVAIAAFAALFFALAVRSFRKAEQ
jgi:ABC-2 type transport system permease protein